MTPKQRESEEQSPWARPSVLISGAFLLLLVLAGILIAVLGGGSTEHHAQATAQPPAPQRPKISGANPNGCSLPAGNQTVPYASPPAGTQWGQVGSMSAPQAPSVFGPQRVNTVWNYCFAHNPAGALLAAFNFWAEGTAAPSGQVYRHLAIDVPAAAYPTSTRLDSDGPVQFAGYKYQSYDPSDATVVIVIRGPQGGLEAVSTEMRWVHNDWRYSFPSNGTPALQQIGDLSGYVQWSAF